MSDSESMAAAEEAATTLRPLVAALLSLLTTGLGHLYVGEPAKAGAFYLCLLIFSIVGIATPLTETFLGLAVAIFIAILFQLYVAFAAARVASRRGNVELERYQRWYVYAAIIIIQAVVVGPLSLAISFSKAYSIPSGSMEPAIMAGDKVFSQRNYYRKKTPQRGEIAIFVTDDPQDPGERAGRIIGLPGESISIRDKVVFIDGVKLDDPWGVFGDEEIFSSRRFLPRNVRLRDNLPPTNTPSGSFFLMGDNRDFSYDCRFIGPIKLERMRHKALYIYWSSRWDRIGTRLDDRSAG